MADRRHTEDSGNNKKQFQKSLLINMTRNDNFDSFSEGATFRLTPFVIYRSAQSFMANIVFSLEKSENDRDG